MKSKKKIVEILGNTVGREGGIYKGGREGKTRGPEHWEKAFIVLGNIL